MKSIEINTTQNVVIDYELALLRERIIAFFLDLLLIAFISYVLITALGWMFGNNGMGAMFLYSLPTLFFFLYHFLFESLNSGQSPGKMLLGLKVVRLDGRAPKWGDALLRAFFHWIDSVLSFGFVGGMLIKSNENSQRYGDLAANTTVIKIQSSSIAIDLDDVLSIMSLENYEPQYPQVQQLTEKDMLSIREILNRKTKLNNTAHFNLVEDTATHLIEVLGIFPRPQNGTEFLKTLIKDYIVLTR